MLAVPYPRSSFITVKLRFSKRKGRGVLLNQAEGLILRRYTLLLCICIAGLALTQLPLAFPVQYQSSFGASIRLKQQQFLKPFVTVTALSMLGLGSKTNQLYNPFIPLTGSQHSAPPQATVLPPSLSS